MRWKLSDHREPWCIRVGRKRLVWHTIRSYKPRVVQTKNGRQLIWLERLMRRLPYTYEVDGVPGILHYPILWSSAYEYRTLEDHATELLTQGDS